MPRIDYTTNFKAFFRDLYRVEGDYGPQPIVPPFLEQWLDLAFPLPDGNPAARNIMDCRTKKEGKSALAGAVALYMATRAENSEVVIVASDKDQAKDRVLKAIKYGVERGPLAAHGKVYKDVIELDNGSIIQAIPNDWQGAAGGNPSCVIFDELYTWVYESNRRVFDELVIPPTQAHGVRWIASYAGWTGESLLLWEWWERALAGEKITDELPVYHNPDASLLGFIDAGAESWRMPWMSKEYIEQQRQTERPNTFRRLWFNDWLSNESQFLPEGTWDGCYSRDVRPYSKGDNTRLVLGADASTSRDLTALIGVMYNEETQTTDVKLVRVWEPKRGILRKGKPTVDLDETIGAEVKRLHDAGVIDAVVADPYQLHTSLINWEKEGIRVIELPQTAGRVEADQALYDAVIGGALRHYNDPTLNEHIRNAVALETARGYRLAKEKTSLKIDAAVALSMAHHGALQVQKLIGGVSIVPDPFAYWGTDYTPLYVDAGHSYIECMPGTEKHKPGITHKNCKRSGELACAACVAELDAEGYYLEQEKERAYYKNIEYRTAEELREMQRVERNPRRHYPTEQELRAEHTSELFWGEVERKVQRGEE